MLVQQDTRRELTEKLFREGTILKLYVGASEFSRQKTQQFFLGQSGGRERPGGRLAFGERSVNSASGALVDQPLLNHSVYKHVHGFRRVLVQQAHQNQRSFLAHCENLS